ncbi:hypothetical protein ENUP19_0081G0020 [Entamoeba nuttalli]|uniref:RhoGAP domain containing protein n=2 Tax=Entamoeba nuttalli TaxID=412467 RepID=K2G4P2_ENTNP|nr:RhoGAP domain containing protein [Entamoeba nuttalli P19]EKE37261.1 RhoGAP domain containing protein [Entamoeba nuttalli P19]|eukprot:XP_008860404.1 RhoGAP domain containing protein [Entamoeba nuttalli P19]
MSEKPNRFSFKGKRLSFHEKKKEGIENERRSQTVIMKIDETKEEKQVGMKEMSKSHKKKEKEVNDQLPSKAKERVSRSSIYRKSLDLERKKEDVIRIQQPQPSRDCSPLMRQNSTPVTSMKASSNLVVTVPKRKESLYKNRRMSWRSKNLSEEKRDISLVAMDEYSPNVLSDKELKDILKNEEKRQKLISSSDSKKKCEIVLDIQCLSYHVVTTLKEHLQNTISQITEKYLKTNTKEIVNISDLIFKSQTGKPLSKNLTLRGVLTLNSTCIFVCYNNRPFSLPHIYPTDISITNPRDAIPQVVFNLCWWIYTYGYLVEGIFRVSGNSDFTKKKAEKCVMCDTSFLFQMHRRASDVHNVVGTLKTYLREYTDGLIDYSEVKDVSAHSSKSVEFAIEVLHKTPREHVLCICILYGLINRLIKYNSIHMMTLKNFAIILGPLVIHPLPGTNAVNTTCNQIDFSSIIINNYDCLMKQLGVSNPFEELPDRDDIQKFDKSAVDKSLKTIRSMSIETPSECEKLRKLMESPDVVQYIQTLDPSLLIDVISIITDCLDF